MDAVVGRSRMTQGLEGPYNECESYSLHDGKSSDGVEQGSPWSGLCSKRQSCQGEWVEGEYRDPPGSSPSKW